MALFCALWSVVTHHLKSTVLKEWVIRAFCLLEGQDAFQAQTVTFPLDCLMMQFNTLWQHAEMACNAITTPQVLTLGWVQDSHDPGLTTYFPEHEFTRIRTLFTLWWLHSEQGYGPSNYPAGSHLEGCWAGTNLRFQGQGYLNNSRDQPWAKAWCCCAMVVCSKIRSTSHYRLKSVWRLNIQRVK